MPHSLGESQRPWGGRISSSTEKTSGRKCVRPRPLPRNARELAFVTILYTPLRCRMARPEHLGTSSKTGWIRTRPPVFLGEVGESRPLELEDVRVLDPAVGVRALSPWLLRPPRGRVGDAGVSPSRFRRPDSELPVRDRDRSTCCSGGAGLSCYCEPSRRHPRERSIRLQS